MQAIYLLATLVAIGWLVVWSILPKPYDGKGWWPLAWSPFDMRDAQETLAANAPTDQATRQSRAQSKTQSKTQSRTTEGRPQRRASGARPATAATIPDPEPAMPKPTRPEIGGPVSWRVRAQSKDRGSRG